MARGKIIARIDDVALRLVAERLDMLVAVSITSLSLFCVCGITGMPQIFDNFQRNLDF